ncbi:MAG: RNA methyltransferase [Deltaproteobacteria bacterium]|nr:RNA methyltransferase [Deltaproteobacteria bacterium]
MPDSIVDQAPCCADRHHIAIVLVEPQGPLNIGSVCRAMANFGFTDLRLVNPQTDHLSEDARKMAVKAGELLESARVYDTLAEALSDRQYSLGTTRRFGRYRDDFLSPDGAANYLADLGSSVASALVFGREDRGLLTEELDLCQRFITIPTSDEFPSMNLAQAVSLCLYELSKEITAGQKTSYGEGVLANTAELENMFSRMRTALTNIEYLDVSNPDHILRTYRRIFGRAGLMERDVRVMQGLWRRIGWLYNQLDEEQLKAVDPDKERDHDCGRGEDN